jgi:hypothetical protein
MNEGREALILQRKEIAEMKKWKVRCQTIASLLSITLLLALPMVATAQVECLGKCEETFAHCLQNGGSDPGIDCLSNYEGCVDACLGGSAAILG